MKPATKSSVGFTHRQGLSPVRSYKKLNFRLRVFEKICIYIKKKKCITEAHFVISLLLAPQSKLITSVPAIWHVKVN